MDGALTNSGAFSIASDTETLAGALGGVGFVSLCSTPGRRSPRPARTASAQAGAVFRRHDLQFRDRRHDRRNELSRVSLAAGSSSPGSPCSPLAWLRRPAQNPGGGSLDAVAAAGIAVRGSI